MLWTFAGRVTASAAGYALSFRKSRIRERMTVRSGLIQSLGVDITSAHRGARQLQYGSGVDGVLWGIPVGEFHTVLTGVRGRPAAKPRHRLPAAPRNRDGRAPSGEMPAGQNQASTVSSGCQAAVPSSCILRSAGSCRSVVIHANWIGELHRPRSVRHSRGQLRRSPWACYLFT